MAQYDRPAGDGSSGTGNTAIVAIVVIILLAVIAFFVFFRPGTTAVEPEDGPDIELEVEPPANDGVPEPGDGGDAGGGGEGAGEAP